MSRLLAISEKLVSHPVTNKEMFQHFVNLHLSNKKEVRLAYVFAETDLRQAVQLLGKAVKEYNERPISKLP